MRSSSNGVEAIFYTLIGGPVLLVNGLRMFQKKRAIENTPCSKIRSAAMGPVELCGTALPRGVIVSPISQSPCCWWRYVVEEYRRSGKRSSWVVIKEVQSPELFYIQDETGQVLVDPQGAETYVNEKIISLGSNNTAAMNQALMSWGVSSTGWLGFGKTMRLREQLILEHHPLYAMGYLTRRVDHVQGRRDRLVAKLRGIKRDAVQMAAADTNKDGTIDPTEWDAFRLAQEETFLKEETAREAAEPVADRFVVRLPEQGPFILSNKSEKDLLSHFGLWAPLAIFGGVALTGLGVWLATVRGFSPAATLGLLALGLLIGSLLKRKGDKPWAWLSWSR